MAVTIRSTNPKIMDDNILKLENAIKAADVSANPTGTAEETLLTTIGIDGKKYNIGASAENVSYDNTDSGLTATNAQAAIDELSEASGISYDNTDSGLTADDVQEAIDELSGKAIYNFTPDGTTTISAALDALYAEEIIDDHSFIFAGTTCFYLSEISSENYFFSSTVCSSNALITHSLAIVESGSKLYRSTTNTSGTTFLDLSSNTNVGFTVYKKY